MKHFRLIACIGLVFFVFGMTTSAMAEAPIFGWELDSDLVGISNMVLSLSVTDLGNGLFSLGGMLSFGTISEPPAETIRPLFGIAVLFSDEIEIALCGVDDEAGSEGLASVDVHMVLSTSTLGGPYTMAVIQSNEQGVEVASYVTGSATILPAPNRNYILLGNYLSVAYHRDFDTNASEADTFDTTMGGDGTGSITFKAGAIIETQIPFTYSVALDGTMEQESTLPDGSDSSGMGIVNGDGSVAAGIDREPDDDQAGLELLMRKSTGMSNASLTGEYVSVGFHSDANGAEPGAGVTATTFDGSGNGTFELVIHSSFDPVTIPFSYVVSSDGTFTHNYTLPDETVSSGKGIAGADGSILFSVDSDPADGIVGIEVAIKKSSGMSNASVKGTYVSVGYHSNAAGTLAGTDEGIMIFDGAGNGMIIYEGGSLFPSPLTIPFTYSVSDDGTITHSYQVPGNTASSGTGIVSADGTMIASTDNDASDDLIGVEFAIKKFR